MAFDFARVVVLETCTWAFFSNVYLPVVYLSPCYVFHCGKISHSLSQCWLGYTRNSVHSLLNRLARTMTVVFHISDLWCSQVIWEWLYSKSFHKFQFQEKLLSLCGVIARHSSRRSKPNLSRPSTYDKCFRLIQAFRERRLCTFSLHLIYSYYVYGDYIT